MRLYNWKLSEALKHTGIWFTMGNLDGKFLPNGETLPPNYTCAWKIRLDDREKYYLTVTRQTPHQEELTLVRVEGGFDREVPDQYLDLISRPNMIDDTKQIEIYARNLYE